MAISDTLGLLEFSLFFLCLAMLLYRIQAAQESRVATALVFIFSARFGASFIDGFLISDVTKLSFGQLDTVFAYVMLAFAFLEVLLLRRVENWSSADLWFLMGLLGLGFLNLTWKLTLKGGVIANDLLYLLTILLFLSLRPKKIDLRFLPYFGSTIIVMVLITALAKYQNPLFPYFQSDYGLGGQYQNRLWDFFGLEERFRGPYHHPNQLGIAITFLSLLVLLKPTRLYIAILPISFTLLFLASSRTSIIALMLGLLARIYFDTSSATKAHSSLMTQDLPKSHSRKKLVPKKMFIGFTVFCFAAMAVRQIIGNNTTGTGRLEAASNTISAVRQNLLLGRGPSLFSTTITENTFLTLLSYYGLIGIALSLVIAFALILKLRKMNHNVRYSFYILLTTFLIAGAGEALLTGTSQDTGLFYLLVLLTLTRVEPPSKDLQSKTPPG